MKIVYKWKDEAGEAMEVNKESHVGNKITETLELIRKLDNNMQDVECQVPDLLDLLDVQATIWMVA